MRRQRVVPAPPDTVWRVVGDPYALPRWWPRVERVESVDGSAWTSVWSTSAGRTGRGLWRMIPRKALASIAAARVGKPQSFLTRAAICAD